MEAKWFVEAKGEYFTVLLTNSNLGQLLAISWSDGSVRLISAETSKVVHQFATEVQPGQVSGVTCMRWATNLMNKTPSSMSFGKTFNSWGDLTEDDTLFPLDRAPLDLPRDLALIDIETALPKLSTLPSAGGSYVRNHPFLN